MVTASKFDGIGHRCRTMFGRQVHELTKDELTSLYRAHGIMPDASAAEDSSGSDIAPDTPHVLVIDGQEYLTVNAWALIYGTTPSEVDEIRAQTLGDAVPDEWRATAHRRLTEAFRATGTTAYSPIVSWLDRKYGPNRFRLVTEDTSA